MKVLVKEGFKGFLFKKGKFIKMVDAGKYSTIGGKSFELAKISDDEIKVENEDTDISIFTSDENFNKLVTKVIAKSGELTLHFVNGNFANIVYPGKHFFWNIDRENTFLTLDLSNPELPEDFPEYLYDCFELDDCFDYYSISKKEIGLLFIKEKFIKTLNPGEYYYLKSKESAVEVIKMKTCLVQQDVVGQEILTSDKVTLRINCVCNYKITDYIKAATEIDDYKNQLYVAIQLALREYVGDKTFDTILATKNEVSKFLSDTIKEKGKELYLDIESVSVKDIILPGEIRDIMNTVLVAEKKAQANVISRREEVASTRSLLNTARLMDENETLYKLKELEYVERICEKVGNINLSTGGDILTQLTSSLTSKRNNKE